MSIRTSEICGTEDCAVGAESVLNGVQAGVKENSKRLQALTSAVETAVVRIYGPGTRTGQTPNDPSPLPSPIGALPNLLEALSRQREQIERLQEGINELARLA